MKRYGTIASIIAVFGIAAAGVFVLLSVADGGSRPSVDIGGKFSTGGTRKSAKDNSLPSLAIESLRGRSYPGSELVIREELSNGSNYERYVASYQSEGLRINGLLTIPVGEKPAGGYPAIVFVHGYIPSGKYSTVDNYSNYQAYLARAGFVTFKPDLRGHADSEGERADPRISPKYIIDTMNAISSLKRNDAVDAERIGYWGHSNGGEIGLQVSLINDNVKAASFWAGLVGSYEDIFETYVDEMSYVSKDNPLTRKYGMPSENPEVWNTMNPYAHLEDISIPIQIQHGTADESVPVEISRHLRDALREAGKTVEYLEYEGDDHNIAGNMRTAWQRTISFFERNM